VFSSRYQTDLSARASPVKDYIHLFISTMGVRNPSVLFFYFVFYMSA
jgi:hypothetical protein